MRIFVNLGIEPNSNANFPVQMEIESIRVLQKVPDVNLSSISDWNDIEGTTATGQNIVIGNSSNTVVVENGNFLTLVATNSISLNPGFEVQKGAIFEADIQEPTSQ